MKKEKKRKWPKVLLWVFGIPTLILVVLSFIGGNKAVNEKRAEEKRIAASITLSPEEAALAAKNPYNNEIFYENRRYGIKRNGQIIADPVWSSIEEVIDGDQVYYCVGYYDKTRADKMKEVYNTSIVSYDTFYGVLDADGKVVIEPDYWKIECGKNIYVDGKKINRLTPFDSDYIVCMNWEDNGKTTKYVNVSGGEDKVYKERSRVDYLVRKGTWDIAFDLGEYNFYAFHDDYIEFTDAYSRHGIYSISQQKELVWVEESKGAWTYHPGIGFTAKQGSQTDESIFIAFNGTYVVSDANSSSQLKLDQDYNMVWIKTARGETPYNGSVMRGGYALYRYDGSRIGDFLIDDNLLNSAILNANRAYVTKDGSIVQFVMNSKGQIQLFDYSSKMVKTIEGAAQVDKWSEGYAAVANSEGKWGYVDEKGEFLVSYQFDEAKTFSNGEAKVVNGYKMYTVDTQGNIK